MAVTNAQQWHHWTRPVSYHRHHSDDVTHSTRQPPSHINITQTVKQFSSADKRQYPRRERFTVLQNKRIRPYENTSESPIKTHEQPRYKQHRCVTVSVKYATNFPSNNGTTFCKSVQQKLTCTTESWKQNFTQYNGQYWIYNVSNLWRPRWNEDAWNDKS